MVAIVIIDMVNVSRLKKYEHSLVKWNQMGIIRAAIRRVGRMLITIPPLLRPRGARAPPACPCLPADLELPKGMGLGVTLLEPFHSYSRTDRSDRS